MEICLRSSSLWLKLKIISLQNCLRPPEHHAREFHGFITFCDGINQRKIQVYLGVYVRSLQTCVDHHLRNSAVDVDLGFLSTRYLMS